MKPKGQLTSIFVAIILFASAISSFGARKHSMPRSTTATGDNEQETFVVYQNENSEVACREADPTEHLRIINRKPTDQTRIIYAGAPVGPQFNASRTWTDSMSGL